MVVLGVAEAGELRVRGGPGLYTETHVRFEKDLRSHSGRQPEARKVLLDGVPILGSALFGSQKAEARVIYHMERSGPRVRDSNSGLTRELKATVSGLRVESNEVRRSHHIGGRVKH